MIHLVKLLVLYHPNSEFASATESFVRDFERTHDVGRNLEMVSVNTRDGAATASLYDIMSYPALLVLSDDGRLLNSWVGMPLPLMDEVAAFMRS